MKTSLFTFLHKSNSVIGWTHGITATLGAVILAYLLATLASTVMGGDYAQRIIPMMIVTPLLMSVFGIWLLFSTSLLKLLIKLFGAAVALIAIIIACVNGLI